MSMALLCPMLSGLPLAPPIIDSMRFCIELGLEPLLGTATVGVEVGATVVTVSVRTLVRGLCVSVVAPPIIALSKLCIADEADGTAVGAKVGEAILLIALVMPPAGIVVAPFVMACSNCSVLICPPTA